MSKIKLLSENLANKIAAGEVVERPASVVKELVENAIDAQSRRIFVSLSEGGIRSIQVQDDGEGMAREDALLAFQRHATSKLADEEDLTSIMTLGFRGEALPSVASISRIRLVTQTSEASEASEGTEMVLEGGERKSVRGIGAPRGSLFEVSDLFYNTPARRKFLKSTQTELSHISDIVFQLALSHPLIHFRLSHEKRRLLDFPPVQHLSDRILQLFGEASLKELMEIHGDAPLGPSFTPKSRGRGAEGLSLDLFFSRPPLRKNHRKDQYLFINQRPVKSPLLSHAIYDAYGSYLMKGEHPFFVLFLSIDPASVDVNVHPTKREVRFQNAEPVHQAVRKMIRGALSSAGAPNSVSSPVSIPFHPYQPTTGRWVGWPDAANEEKVAYQSGRMIPGAAGAEVGERNPPPEALLTATPLIRPLGQVYETFLLAEIGGEMTLVDQHTAHERFLYETLLEQRAKMSLEIQPLLVPQQVDLPLRWAGILKDYLKNIEALGWKIEPFGETTFLVREIPALMAKINMEAFLLELAEELAEVGVASQDDQPTLKIIASMACHGAVRAGQSLRPEEIKALLRNYFERKIPPTCPHGRPILIKYPLLELEKLFRRK